MLSICFQIYMTAAKWIDDRLYMCGGRTCDPSCTPKNTCWTWDPQTDTFTVEAESLVNTRSSHKMFELPKANDSDTTTLFPTVVGGSVQTEMKKGANGEWENHEIFDVINLSASDCLIEYNNHVYAIKVSLKAFSFTKF